MLTTFILKNNSNKEIVENINKDKKFIEYEIDDLKLTQDILKSMAEISMHDYFYVIKTTSDLQFSFDFSFRPKYWDKNYLHIWNNSDILRLYNRDSILIDQLNQDDNSLNAGILEIKNIDENIYKNEMYDIIFISYDESYADDNFNNLKKRFPRANRLHNIKGIFEAHKCAAEWAQYNKSRMFYVVDADAIIDNNFNFDYIPNMYDQNLVHIWHSRNPINDLEYGYGGIKLFPTQSLIDAKSWGIDFTTTVTKNLKVIPAVSNITAFNSDPFSTWKSAFRECVKLSTGIIPNQNNEETEFRLNAWCTIGEDREYGDFAILGANEGKTFGELYKNNPEMLKQINDFKWLEQKFSDEL